MSTNEVYQSSSFAINDLDRLDTVHQRTLNSDTQETCSMLNNECVSLLVTDHWHWPQGDHSPDDVKFPDNSPTVRDTRHVKCYSYHACTSTRYAAYNKQFWPVFPHKIFTLTFPWLLVKSLTFPWQLSNSLTFPSFPDKWALTLTTDWRCCNFFVIVANDFTYLLTYLLNTTSPPPQLALRLHIIRSCYTYSLIDTVRYSSSPENAFAKHLKSFLIKNHATPLLTCNWRL